MRLIQCQMAEIWIVEMCIEKVIGSHSTIPTISNYGPPMVCAVNRTFPFLSCDQNVYQRIARTYRHNFKNVCYALIAHNQLIAFDSAMHCVKQEITTINCFVEKMRSNSGWIHSHSHSLTSNFFLLSQHMEDCVRFIWHLISSFCCFSRYSIECAMLSMLAVAKSSSD